MTSLLEPAADWVTLTAQTPEGSPVEVVIDRAIVTTAPYEAFTTQVAIACSLGETADGLPADSDKPNLRLLEQGMVDAASGEARLVARTTLEGMREWMFYARTTDWARAFAEGGMSVKSGSDPAFHGLLELAGATE